MATVRERVRFADVDQPEVHHVDRDLRIEIKMSMTAPGCGMGDVLKEDACRKVQGVAGVTEVDIEIVWEPVWDQRSMSEAAQLQLGLL